MRVTCTVVGALVSIATAVPIASAQDQERMSAAAIAAACTPPPGSSRAAHALRIVGAQDTVPRTILSSADLLIVNGGNSSGVQLGSMFFLRRSSTTVQTYGMPTGREDVVTDGWVRVVAVNESTSIARVDHQCGPIYVSDYLEPFAVPDVTASTDSPLEPDFSALGHIVSGSDGHTITGINQIAILDRGSEQGLQAGSRFAIYRDPTSGVDPLLAAPAGTPLTPIGEGIVLSSSGNRAIARIVRARDAVRSGDYVAPAKK